MIKYQVQFKKKTKTEGQEKSIEWDVKVSDESSTMENTWEVVSEHPTLKSAIISAKTLIKKHGYDRVRICRSTNMKINIELES